MAEREMRIVRTKSIPNVPSDRLCVDLGRLHAMLHTPEGLRAFDAPRRSLFDQGMKARAIATELVRRGFAPTGCRFCAPRNVEHFSPDSVEMAEMADRT